MPCISMALVGRPDEHDHFVLEFSAGPTTTPLHDLLGAAGDASGADGSAWRNAWLSGKIVILDQLSLAAAAPHGQDSALPEEAGASSRIRSAAFIPVLDAQGRALVLIGLLGRFPGQFSHASMRMWLETIQHMVTPALLRIEKIGSSPIDAQTRRHYHDLLFGDGLRIVVQPVIELATGKVSKVEALARLQDADRLLSPAAFLPSFGKQDLRALFRMGLDRVLDWVAQWERQGLSVGASLNLPPSVLVAADCPRWIAEGIARHDVPAQRLYLELLETEDDAGMSAERDAAIARLADIGVRLVMDDLGAGYASLQRMRTLPFHTVKVDQGLVRAAASEPSRTIPFIRSLIEMAQCLQLEVVVEGLETDELIDMARRLGAEYGQGYAIARPMPPEQLADWAERWNAETPLSGLRTSLGEFSASFRRTAAQGA